MPKLKKAGFPKELLTRPVDERIDHFHKFSIKHASQDSAYNNLKWKIENPGDTRIIFLIGLTGTGKTKTLDKVLSSILSSVDLNSNPGAIPAAKILLAGPDYGVFKWPNYYRDCLKTLHEPMINDKISRCKRTLSKEELKLIQGQNSSSPHVLRETLEDAFKYRNVKYFFVDQAHLFEKVGSGRKLVDQMETIQGLVDTTRVVHILVGTYDLVHLCNLSGQLARRSNVIHLPRYRSYIDAEMNEFKRVLAVFLKELPVEKEIDFADDTEYFYVRCVGCVGILKLWLNEVLEFVLKTGSRTIERKHLDKFALKPKQLAKIAAEAAFGEQSLYSKPEEYKELWEQFNVMPSYLKNTSADNRDEVKDNKCFKKRSIKVGLRKATRDAVGA